MPRASRRHFAILAAALVFWIMLQFSLPERNSAPPFRHQTPLSSGRKASKAAKRVEPPLRTQGRYILDAQEKRVKLVSVNWHGASDVLFAPMGLDIRHRTEIAKTIVDMGFNSVRFPYSDQMVMQNPRIDPVYLVANRDLYEDDGSGVLLPPRALDVYKACVEAMTEAGLAVVINNHITNAHFCDGKSLCDSSWKNDHLGPLCSIKQTTASWIDHWLTVMQMFIDNGLVIGADLRNEPRGLWGTMTWSAWASAAEQAGEALLRLQPNWLIFVEGISSANDCSSARNRPISLPIPNRVVYSSHVYAWSGWGSLVPFKKRTYASFAAEMERNWAYLLREEIAPVWVGEFGGSWEMSDEELNYWNHLMQFLDDTDADWGIWALNPHRPDQPDGVSYGLLQDDWFNVWDDIRMRDLRRLMGSLV